MVCLAKVLFFAKGGGGRGCGLSCQGFPFCQGGRGEGSVPNKDTRRKFPAGFLFVRRTSSEGQFFEPTVLADVTEDMLIAQEEKPPDRAGIWASSSGTRTIAPNKKLWRTRAFRLGFSLRPQKEGPPPNPRKWETLLSGLDSRQNRYHKQRTGHPPRIP